MACSGTGSCFPAILMPSSPQNWNVFNQGPQNAMPLNHSFAPRQILHICVLGTEFWMFLLCKQNVSYNSHVIDLHRLKLKITLSGETVCWHGHDIDILNMNIPSTQPTIHMGTCACACVLCTQDAFRNYSEDEPINLQEEEVALTLHPRLPSPSKRWRHFFPKHYANAPQRNDEYFHLMLERLTRQRNGA